MATLLVVALIWAATAATNSEAAVVALVQQEQQEEAQEPPKLDGQLEELREAASYQGGAGELPPLLDELQDDAFAKKTCELLASQRQMYANSAARKKHEEIVDACDRAYLATRPWNIPPLPVYYQIREVFRQVERMHAACSRLMFGSERLWTMKNRLPGFEEEAEGQTAILNDQSKRFKYEREQKKWNKLCLKQGCSYLTYDWRKYTHHRYKRSDLAKIENGDAENLWEIETNEIEQGAPGIKALSFRYTYTHPFVEHIEDSPAVAIVQTLSAAALKTLVREGWLDPDRTKAAVQAGAEQGNYRSEDWRRDQPFEPLLGSLGGDHPFEVEITFTNDGMEYVRIGEHLVRGQLCPYGRMPLLELKNYPQEEQHFGFPEALLLLADQEMLNTFMSLFVVSAHINFTPMMLMTQNVAKQWGNTTWKPGGKLVVGSKAEMDEIQSLNGKMQPTAMDLASTAPMFLRNMRATTSNTEEFAGIGSQQGTATGVVRMQDAAGLMAEGKVKEWSASYIDLGRALVNLNAKYLEGEYAVRIAGTDGLDAFQRYKRTVFEADVDVEIELGNGMESGPEAAQNMRTLAPFCINNPLVNQSKFFRKLFKAHGEQRPSDMLNVSLTPQNDALKEYQQWSQIGYIGEPKPSDNHMTHLQIHQLQMQSPEFQALKALRPLWAAQFEAHAAVHQFYVMQMQQQAAAAAQAAQVGRGPSPSGVANEANARTEAMFDNGATGAAQQSVTV